MTAAVRTAAIRHRQPTTSLLRPPVPTVCIECGREPDPGEAWADTWSVPPLAIRFDPHEVRIFCPDCWRTITT